MEPALPRKPEKAIAEAGPHRLHGNDESYAGQNHAESEDRESIEQAH
jgi:hypothetical protein